MGSTRHEKSFVDFDKPYEQNIVGLKGIIYFGIGLLLLIVITFGLMWSLMNVLEDNAKETKSSDNPMAMTDRERIPPEPRLQLAPGFGIDSPDGRVNLELNVPQSEFRELKKQWQDEWTNGVKDKQTGTVTVLPIDEAKQIYLQQQNANAAAVPGAEKLLEDSRLYINDSSSGRAATLKRR
jgi:hypothetical protein